MQNVLITGAGRPQALGFNLVRRYLEHGDRVFACVRKPADAFDELPRAYPEALTVLVMLHSGYTVLTWLREEQPKQVERRNENERILEGCLHHGGHFCEDDLLRCR